ncbi:MAG: TonB-dependent receptor [Chitinophagaceae bacterium]
MKNLIVLLSIVMVSCQLIAQVTISGKIKDNKGKPVPGASISLKDTYDGAVSDSLGNYIFTASDKGEFTFLVTNIGYKSYEQKLTVGTTAITLDVTIKEELSELKAVTVISGSFAAGDTRRAATVLTSLDVATIGGGNADITSAARTLPGAQQIGEREGLFVRGGTGTETKQFIDGTLVNNPYFSNAPDLGNRGRFSPFLFKGMVFSTGGYSALYGQAMSSALILESIDLPERSAANLSVSPIILGGGFQDLSKDKKASWGVNYNYVNLIAYFNIVKQTPDYFTMPATHSGDANFRIKTKNGIIKYYTTFSKSDMGLRRQDIDSLSLKDAFGLKNVNWYNNLSWRENLRHGWKMNLGAGYSTNTDNINQQLQNSENKQQFINNEPWLQAKNFTLKNRQDLSQIKAVFEKRLFGISTIRFGSEYMYSVNNNNYNDTAISKLVDNFQSLFAETDIYVTNDLAAKIGGRFEHSSIIDKINFAPRISLAYKVGIGAQVSAAYGIFYQKPEYQQLIYTRNLGYTQATHYILTYQKTTNDRIFRTEVYYKKYADLVKTNAITFNYATYTNGGSGYAKGVEFFWRDKKTFKNFDYWVSYSYLDTKREFLNYPEKLFPDFAANHTASLVTKRFFMDIKTGFNFTYSYASGRPYYNFMFNGAGNKYVIADQGKTKDYHNVGFSMNYVPSVGKPNAKVFWVLVD